MKRFLFFFIFMLFFFGLKAQETITVLQYNLLEYGNYESGWAHCDEVSNNTQVKDEGIRTVLNYVKPDILTVNEFGASQEILDDFMRHNLNINGVDYWRSDNIVNYHGSTIINHIFYNSEKMVLKKHAVIRTSVRDIDAYELYMKTAGLASQDTVKLVCIVAHLKAGNENNDINKRYNMLLNAMYYVEEHYAHDNVLIMGDFNMYSSAEPGYRLLVNDYSNFDARFVDPLSLVGGVGNWNENRQFAPFHTQSTKKSVNYEDCPSGGGLDDRFDIMMMSDEVLLGHNKLRYVEDSYKAVGNDGNHFNLSVNQGANNAVPREVANALFDVSDHLPITMQLNMFAQWDVDEYAVADFRVYPNPTDGVITVEIRNATSLKEYRITNLMGQTLLTGSVDAESSQIDVSSLPSGMYFITLGPLTTKFIHL